MLKCEYFKTDKVEGCKVFRFIMTTTKECHYKFAFLVNDQSVILEPAGSLVRPLMRFAIKEIHCEK